MLDPERIRNRNLLAGKPLPYGSEKWCALSRTVEAVGIAKGTGARKAVPRDHREYAARLKREQAITLQLQEDRAGLLPLPKWCHEKPTDDFIVD